MARKRRIRQQEENLDRWMVSYADFITLLFAFFVVMYAVSSVNEGKYKQVSSSLISAFKTLPKSLEPIQVGDISRAKNKDVIDTPLAKPGESGEGQSANFKELGDQIEMEILNSVSSEEITLRRSEDWLEVEMNSSILFFSGDFQLVDSAKPILRKIAKILSPYPNPINVEGFTDNIPIHTEVFRSNWELSAARAATVVHLFSKSGIEPSRMSAIGYAEYRPIEKNDTEAGRLKNRRVVIAILAKDMNIRNPNSDKTPKIEENGIISH